MELVENIEEIMLDELGAIGPFIVRKQLKDIGMSADGLTKKDLPRVARTISEVMSTFGKDKARSVHKRINDLADIEEIVSEEEYGSQDRLDGLFDLAESARLTAEYDEAMNAYDRLIFESLESGDNLHVGYGHTMKGYLLNEMNRPNDALGEFASAEEPTKICGDMRLKALLHRGKGYSRWRLGEYSGSFEQYEICLDLAKNMKDSKLQGMVLIDMGLLHDTQGDHKQALKSFQDAITVLKWVDDQYNISRAYNNMGEVHKQHLDFEKAIDCYERCKQMANKSGNERMAGFAMGNTAECYAKLGMTGKAKKYAEETMKIFKASNDLYMISGVHLTYGIIYSKENDLVRTMENFETAISMLKQLGYPYEIGTNTFEYAKALKAKAQREEARDMFLQARKVFEDLDSTKYMEEIEEELKDL